MEDFKYINELFSSLKEVLKKPVLLMPFLYILIVVGLFAFFTPNYARPPPGELPPLKDIISMTVLFLAQFLVIMIFYGMGLVGMRMYADGETVTCKSQASKGIKIYWKVLLQKIYLCMVIIVVPGTVIFLLYRLIQNSKLDVEVAGLILLIMFVLFIVHIIAMTLFYIFSSVIIAYEGKGLIISLRESHKYFKEDMGHIVLTFFSILLLSVIALVVILLVSIPLVLFSENQTVMFFQNIVMWIIVLLLFASITLYLFKAYIYGNKDMNKNIGANTEIREIVVPSAKKDDVKAEEVQPPAVVVPDEKKEKATDEIMPVETLAEKTEDSPADKLEIKLKSISKPSKPKLAAKPMAKQTVKPAAKAAAKTTVKPKKK